MEAGSILHNYTRLAHICWAQTWSRDASPCGMQRRWSKHLSGSAGAFLSHRQVPVLCDRKVNLPGKRRQHRGSGWHPKPILAPQLPPQPSGPEFKAFFATYQPLTLDPPGICRTRPEQEAAYQALVTHRDRLPCSVGSGPSLKVVSPSGDSRPLPTSGHLVLTVTAGPSPRWTNSRNT